MRWVSEVTWGDEVGDAGSDDVKGAVEKIGQRTHKKGTRHDDREWRMCLNDAQLGDYMYLSSVVLLREGFASMIF